MLEIKFDANSPEDVEKAAVLVRFLRSPGWWDTNTVPLEPNAVPFTAAAAPSSSAPEAAPDFSPVQTSGYLAPVPGNTDERDAEGLPWDERIHSGNKTKVQAGTWTRRRNIPDEYYQSIRDELKAQYGAVLPQFGAKDQSVPTHQAVAVPPTPPIAPEPPAPPQPDQRAPTPTYVNPFVGLAQRVAAGIKSGKFSQDTIATLLATLGNPEVTKLADFMSHHEAIPAMNALLDSME